MEVDPIFAKLTNVQMDQEIGGPAYQIPYQQPPIPIEPTPDAPPWGSGAAFGLWVVSVLAILIFPTVFLLPYLATITPPLEGSEQVVEFAKSDPTAVVLQILAVIPAHFLTMLLAWALITRIGKFSFRKTLGWETGGTKIWLSYPIIVVLFFTIAAVVGNYFPEQDNDLLRILKSSRSAVYIIAFLATFTAPIVEEVVYRGVLYSAFQRTMGVPLAFLLVTLLFAIVHVPQYYPSWTTIGLLGLLSITLTLMRVYTKNLLPCIILHTIFNGIQSILLLLQPYIENQKAETPAGFLHHLLSQITY